MAELVQLKSKRAALKSKLTRFRTYLNSIIDQEKSESMYIQLQVRLEKIEPLFEEFDALQSEIELLDTSETDEIERDSFESVYFELISKAKSYLKTQDDSGSSVAGSGVSSQSATRPGLSLDESVRSLVKLPPIALPKFEGQYGHWLEFKDIFMALVHENQSLTNIQRFYYLRTSLVNEAAKMISSLHVSADNYNVAWQMLTERFENKNMIVHNHIRDLFEYPKLQKESHVELRNLFDSFNKHLRSLNALGENTDAWDRLIIYIICNKFDSVTRRDWESFKIAGDLPALTDMNGFLKKKCEVLEKLENCKSEESKSDFKTRKARSYGFASTENKDVCRIRCYYCKEEHSIFQCKGFLNLSISDRIFAVRQLKLCTICLRDTHPFWKCKARKCPRCQKSHNAVLHLESKLDKKDLNSSNDGENSVNPETNGNAAAAITTPIRDDGDSSDLEKDAAHGLHCDVARLSDSSQVLLSTAVVLLESQGKTLRARALLDSGSQSNFMSEKLCRELDLRRSPVKHVVRGIGQTLSNVNQQVSVRIQSCDGEFHIEVRCLVMPNVICKLPSVSFNKKLLKIPPWINLADPSFNEANDVDLLLGSDIFWKVMTPGYEALGSNLPILKNTLFGWVVAGNTELSKCNAKNSINCHLVENTDRAADDLLQKFWEIEEVSKNKALSQEERFCEHLFEKTVKRNDEGRFIVKIPFKPNIKDLGNSKEIAQRRFHLLERKLERNPELRQDYVKFMTEYETLNHMSEVDAESSEGYFLPHHAVVKTNSLTTNCRVVFDSSCKTDAGLSLNDVQYIGPTLQEDIFAILLRFRTYRYVMTADISKMYRQILVDPDQRKYQKIFWRSTQGSNLKVFSLNTVTYGNASSPYLAVKCLFQVAAEVEDKNPDVSKIIKRDFYMDDLLTGANDEKELLKMQKQITGSLNAAGFPLRKWLCNDSNILRKFELNENLEVSVVHIKEGEHSKTLGIFWDSNQDTICYKINTERLPLKCPTKRSILSVICQIYDPLGLLGPLLTAAKLIMQELWKHKCGWDEPISSEILRIWEEFQSDLKNVNNIKVPRQGIVSNYIKIEIHGFSDASTKAYGACVYIRCSLSSGLFASHLFCAKSRVAPLKQISLPRLELCGAVLLSQLMNKTMESLGLRFDGKYFWTDSTIVLCWIKSSPIRWKTFIANRVSEIQSLTDTKDWGYVRSSENPADLVSRGALAENLIQTSLWWIGPSWFQLNNSNWDFSSDAIVEPIPEERVTVSHIATKEPTFVHELLSKISSLTRVLRVLAYVRRFIYNLRSKKKQSGLLVPSEIEDALMVLIVDAQMQSFPQEYSALKREKPVHRSSSLLSLNPFFYKGLIRVGGRLRNATQPFDKKYPIILPSNHELTSRILKSEHERLLHCGVQLLLCSVRERYWPISGRNLCKKVVRNCVVCFRSNPRPLQYLMGDLPATRVSSTFPFCNVGTDYGGPFFIRDRKTRGAKITKAYICLFICMSTKAVHLELVTELSTEAFLAAFKRFVGRRGRPANIYSDNGTNYVGANNEIGKVYEFLEQHSEAIANQLGIERIRWHFIPAKSPNFGGIWEAGIKSTKSHLKRVIGTRTLTFEEFSTVLTQVEGILNSRPMCPLTSDPEDLSTLTPAHFLIGRSLTALPERDLTNVPENRLKRWQTIQSIIQHYWTRWHKEYLAELQTRVKWRQRYPELLQVGALVLLKEDNMLCCNWPLGRVTELIPGADGIVRVARVKIRNTEVTRAINRLCVLPNVSGDMNSC